MFFDDLKIGMTVEIAPVVIEKELVLRNVTEAIVKCRSL